MSATPPVSPGSRCPTVALALGGGGARGLAHIPVIEALDELGIRPCVIAGTSIGAIMGAGMAAGMRGHEIREFALSTVGRRTEIANRLWRLRPSTLQAIGGSLRFGPFNLERVLSAFLPEAIPESFEALSIPLKVIATDYYAQGERVLETGDLRTAIAASAALPGMFQPVRLGGRVMIDGGFVNPVPFDHLHGLADIVLAVDVVGGPEGDGTTLPSRMDAMFGASQLMMQTIIAMKMTARPPDLLVRPTVGRIRVMDFLRAQEVLAMSAGVKDEVKRQLDRLLSA
ncbi:Patatin [Rhizobium sp. Leaf384]|uniref:patatin-like phospholipase family protein n=1 Tax=unclassified Rhizobium TaxID=2613769 RepID=UPI000713529F|nr:MULTISPECIES: patatin-like phospholipase family protein [unclassified Rhizobium]KQS77291.1 Patatin [Rhizobium sp. Leaf383]KQS80786.1 Patatin [Rhizobium sp. Leaf384]